MTGQASVIDLAAHPKKAAAAAERERSKRNAPGFLGITQHPNPQAGLFCDGTVEVEAYFGSPAFKAGIRSGDIVQAITAAELGRMPLDRFQTSKLPAGTSVGIEFYRGGQRLAVECKLARWPRQRRWELLPRISPGPRVRKKERAAFLSKLLGKIAKTSDGTEYEPGYLSALIAAHQTRSLAFAYLATLILLFDNDKNRGVWPSHDTMAHLLGTSARTVYELQRMLLWFGVLRLVERRGPARASNLCEITWPLGSLPIENHKPAPSPEAGGGIRRVRC